MSADFLPVAPTKVITVATPAVVHIQPKAALTGDGQIVGVPLQVQMMPPGGVPSPQHSAAVPQTISSVNCTALAGPCQLLAAPCQDQKEIRQSVQGILADHYGTHVFRWIDLLQIIALIAFIGVAVWAINTQDEKLVQLAEFIEDLGLVGHLLFFFIFLWVGLPFGYNWSTSVVLVGFAYGWSGIPCATAFTALSAIVSYYSSRYCMRSCVQRRLESTTRKKRMYLMAVTQVMESGRGGFLMQVLVRLQPIQTFGLTNAFFGVFTTIPMWKYTLTTLLGMEHNIVLLISIGILVRDVGSLGEAAKSESGQANLIITAIIAIVTVIGCVFFARYLAIHVLPTMIDQDALVDDFVAEPSSPALPGLHPDVSSAVKPDQQNLAPMSDMS